MHQKKPKFCQSAIGWVWIANTEVNQTGFLNSNLVESVKEIELKILSEPGIFKFFAH